MQTSINLKYECADNCSTKVYMFNNIGYFLEIVFNPNTEIKTLCFDFFLNKEKKYLSDGIRIFNEKKLFKYKDIIVQTYSYIFNLLYFQNSPYVLNLILHLGDFPSGNPNVISWAKRKDDIDLLSYTPDVFKFIFKKDQYQNQFYNNRWNWKTPKAIFRGSLSGEITKTNPRLRAVFLSEKRPDILDAKLVFDKNYYLCKNNSYVKYTVDCPSTNFECGDIFMSLQKQTNYKYILHIDGFVSAWRMIWALYSHSVILKVDSDYVENFYRKLIPDVHYIPIKSDLSDLIEKIDWCICNDTECKIISENAYNFATTNLNKKKIINDTINLIEEYIMFDIQSSIISLEEIPLETL